MSAVTDRMTASDVRVIARLLAAARQRLQAADAAPDQPDQDDDDMAGRRSILQRAPPVVTL